MKIFQSGLERNAINSLSEKGFLASSDRVNDVEELLEFIEYESYDALVLDVDHCHWATEALTVLRKKEVRIPIIGIQVPKPYMLWAENRAEFLEAGGNDLLQKPFHLRELAASLRCLHRLRLGRINSDTCEFRKGAAVLRINFARNLFALNQIELSLTAMEALLLTFLASRRGEIVKRQEIVSSLYGMLDIPIGNTIEVFITRLRKKLADIHPDARDMIITLRGLGYSLSDDNDKVLRLAS